MTEAPGTAFRARAVVRRKAALLLCDLENRQPFRDAGSTPVVVEDQSELVTPQTRLHRRYRHLDRRIGRHKAVTAVGRELAGFVWAIGQRMEASTA